MGNSLSRKTPKLHSFCLVTVCGDGCEVDLTVVVILQHVRLSSHYVVHLELMCFVSYISV